MSKVAKSLEKLYSKHRIVMWYDPEQVFEDEVASLALDQVSIIKVDNDELAVKYRILKEEPQQKFLLYLPYAKPAHEDNWLLDIELSQKVFHTDQESMLLQELELPFHYQSWLKGHTAFFKSKERLHKFRSLLQATDSVQVLNLKLIQVLIGSEQSDLDQLLRDYANAFVADSSDTLHGLLEKFGLASIFWDEVHLHYGINNESHQLYDFLLKLYQYSFEPICGKGQVLNKAKVTLSNWKDLRSFSSTFDALSAKIEKDLHISVALDQVVLEDILEDDLFEEIERRIIRDLIKKVCDKTYDAIRVDELVKKRSTKHWYAKYQHYYLAIWRASQLMEAVQEVDYSQINSLVSGFELYSKQYFKIDQYYRQFISLLRQVNSGILQPLYQEIEKVYSNRWLLELSDQWQGCIEKSKGWYFEEKRQSSFFERIIQSKYVQQKKKVFVIISDALRYEVGEELHRNINQQNRFVSKLDYMVTSLPSYTQLGMASLLPHQHISLGEGDDIVLDGEASKGLQARAKILNKAGKLKATTILADELASYKVKSEEAKALVQDHDVVYVYHNIIDKTGDDKTSEEKVFDAVQSELKHLIQLIKRISNFNVTHIVITADHGFIYQNESLAESDFADAAISGTISKSNRRFVIGHALNHNDAVIGYKAKELQIESDAEILIPKGMNRLRRQGAGSRFIHGGAMLQEVMIPLLLIQKKKEDTLAYVDIDIINKSNNKITTNIHPVKFYQTTAVAERVLGRNIKAYIAIEEAGKRQVISDVFIHAFDKVASRSEDREIMHQFRISTHISRHSNVFLYLEEQIEGSTQWRDYTKYSFSLNLGMMNDFDEF